MSFDYVFSDPHFGHTNIIRLAERPFASLDEMEGTMIENYCRRVKPNQTVLWLGDNFFGPVQRGREILNGLPGHKMTLVGNHDGSASRLARIGFDAVLTGEVMIRLWEAHTFVFSHYPYESRPGDDRFIERRPKKRPGTFLVHGHTHSKERWKGRMINACVDAWDFSPVPVGDLLQWALLKTAGPPEIERLETLLRGAGLLPAKEKPCPSPKPEL